MIFKAVIYQKFAFLDHSYSATGEFNTETLLFSITEKEYKNLLTTNDLNNIDLKGEDDPGADSYEIWIDDENHNDNDNDNTYPLNEFRLWAFEAELGIDFTTDRHSYQIHELYSPEYNTILLHNKLDNKIPNKETVKKQKI